MVNKDKMKEEFDLSEKYRIAEAYPDNDEVISVADIKEFIKRLKEETSGGGIFTDKFHEVLNKLAGEKFA